MHASLLPYVDVTYTRRSYQQLQKLEDDEQQAFIIEHLQCEVCHGEGVGTIASQSIGQTDCPDST